MPPKRIPWIKVETPMVSHEKLTDLSSDSARWGWLVLLCRTKTARPGGIYASLAQLREEAGRFGRFVPQWQKAGLIDVAADGRASIHDWRRYQYDPTNADRQDRHRNGDSNADSNGDRNGDSRAHARGDSRQETVSPSGEGDTRSPDQIELATRRLRHGNASPTQIETMRGFAEQVGEPTVLTVLEAAYHEPKHDRYGIALRRLEEIAADRKPSRRQSRAVTPLTSYDSVIVSDDDEAIPA